MSELGPDARKIADFIEHELYAALQPFVGRHNLADMRRALAMTCAATIIRLDLRCEPCGAPFGKGTCSLCDELCRLTK